MSAIRSLLRVMTLRGADAIVLEANKVPSLRRRGQVEALSMPALDGKLLADFATPLVEGRTVDDWPASVPFRDPEGGSYQCTIEKVPAGLRVVVRPSTVTPAAPPPTDHKPRAWWAQPSPSKPASAALPSPPASGGPGPDGLHDAPRSAPPPMAGLARLAQLLAGPVAIARERGASDVFLSTGQPPRIRVDGRIEAIDAGGGPDPSDDAELAAAIAALGSNTDHSLELEGTRLRVNAFDHLNGFAVAARLIRDRVPGLAELGLPPELAAIVELRDGLVLVCGPSGAGKSTTLASLVDLLDQRRAAHVITLEDPIEYRFAARRCLIHQRELGAHVPTFAAGLKAALREAPDVILLGELRDRDTIAAALTAAETGHLVLATLHAPNATGAIDRMIDAFADAQQRQIRWQLAAVLRTVVTQYLLPRRDGGRAVAFELVPVTTAVANIMRKGELHTLPTVIQSGREAGMIPLERSLARLVDTGVVSPHLVKKIAADHDLISALSGKPR